jgi:hypothetical protein
MALALSQFDLVGNLRRVGQGRCERADGALIPFVRIPMAGAGKAALTINLRPYAQRCRPCETRGLRHHRSAGLERLVAPLPLHNPFGTRPASPVIDPEPLRPGDDGTAGFTRACDDRSNRQNESFAVGQARCRSCSARLSPPAMRLHRHQGRPSWRFLRHSHTESR